MVARYANGVKLVLRENNWIPLGSCPVRFEGETGWVETADSGKYAPSSPELLPRPPGQVSVAERMSSHVELSVDAQRKTTLAA